jgi:hypothetical protein
MQAQAKTFSVIFYLRNRRFEEGKVLIYARVTIDGKRMEQSMKHSISPMDWDEKKAWQNQKAKSLNT